MQSLLDPATRDVAQSSGMALSGAVNSDSRSSRDSTTTKILVVGQTPPPCHGQALMIRRLLTSELANVELIHVRMGFSSQISDLGKVRFSKVLHMFGLILRIIYRRFADGVRILYYPPTGAERMSMFRDIAVLLAVRWLFDKTIFHFHAGGVTQMYDQLPAWQRWLYRRAYYGADAAIRLSELSPEDGKLLAAKREYVIPNGIEDPCPERAHSPANAAATGDDRLRMLYVGALSAAKGIMVLIEACSKLSVRGVPFHLELIGQWESDEFAKRVAQRINKLNLGNHVRFLGHVPDEDKFAAYRRADVFSFPSLYDTFPVVLLEAMAFGLPVVATRISGLRSIVVDDVTGFLVEPNDSEAVSEQLARLAQDSQLRERLGRAGRVKFEREYILSRHADRMRRALLETAGVAVEKESDWDVQLEPRRALANDCQQIISPPRKQETSVLKVLVVGQTPPPYGGTPIMVESFLRSSFTDVQLLHVRMGFASHIEEHGKITLFKIFHLVSLIARIFYRRVVDRPQVLYYVPAGPVRVTVLRDLPILLLTRWLFDETVFHFHLGGVSELYGRLPSWQRWLFRRAYFGADAAIRISEQAPEDGRLLQAKSEYVIPNGIEDPCPAWNDLPPSRRSSVHEPLRIVFVGGLSEAKGITVLVETCGILAARGVLFQLEVVGQWDSGELAARVGSRIEELNLGSQIRFLGMLVGEEKFDAYRRADVLCFPTFFETFGLVLVEAMACGLPVVSTRCGGVPSVVDEGKTGFLVEPNDPDAIADRLHSLAHDEKLRMRMGAAGREKFLQEFTLDRHLNRMRNVFLDIAGVTSGLLSLY